MSQPDKQDPASVRDAIEEFLRASGAPALVEPGDDPMALDGGRFFLELVNGRLTLQAWDGTRNVVRRITRVESRTAGALRLVFERFGKKTGVLSLIDAARPRTGTMERRGHRRVFREQFRRFLSRQFCGWKIAELSAEPDLEHSLSPAFPRALLRQGSAAWAAIAAPPDCLEPAACLTYGLIWLSYLRRRESRLAVAGLAVFVPDRRARTTALRLRVLRPDAARYLLFLYGEDGHETSADASDCGNLETVLPVCRQPAGLADPLVRTVAAMPDVECVVQNDGSASLRVRGLPFAVHRDGHLLFGLENRRRVGEGDIGEVVALATELVRLRAPDARDTQNPLYRKSPEAWLESQARASIGTVDPSLLPEPVYGQVPAFAGGDRNVIDLLAVNRFGRLAVVELKASEDPHLPLQALDYWMRVEWHARQGDFTRNGYFPGIPLSPQPPRLILVSPALRYHPSAEDVLSYLPPEVEVERVGLGEGWRDELKVAFRARGASSAVWGAPDAEASSETKLE